MIQPNSVTRLCNSTRLQHDHEHDALCRLLAEQVLLTCSPPNQHNQPLHLEASAMHIMEGCAGIHVRAYSLSMVLFLVMLLPHSKLPFSGSKHTQLTLAACV